MERGKSGKCLTASLQGLDLAPPKMLLWALAYYLKNLFSSASLTSLSLLIVLRPAWLAGKALISQNTTEQLPNYDVFSELLGHGSTVGFHSCYFGGPISAALRSSVCARLYRFRWRYALARCLCVRPYSDPRGMVVKPSARNNTTSPVNTIGGRKVKIAMTTKIAPKTNRWIATMPFKIRRSPFFFSK